MNKPSSITLFFLGYLILATACNLSSLSETEYIGGLKNSELPSVGVDEEKFQQFTAQEKFLSSVQGRVISLLDIDDIESSGTFSSDGRTLMTNSRTLSIINQGSDAKLTLYSPANPYALRAVTDTEGYVATYYSELYRPLTDPRAADFTIMNISVTLNNSRTGGVIRTQKIYSLYENAALVAGYPVTNIYTANFTLE